MAVQRGMQLVAADIDRKHDAAPLASSTSVKPPVEAPDIETDAVLDIDGVSLQRAGELDAAARDKG